MTKLLSISASPDTPVACDMTTAEDSLAVRLAEYRRLFDHALLGRRESTTTSTTFRLADRPGVREWVLDLVRRESECCPFLTFEVDADDDQLTWHAQGLEGADLAMLDEILATADRQAAPVDRKVRDRALQGDRRAVRAGGAVVRRGGAGGRDRQVAAALGIVRLTARTSAALFASAQAAPLAGKRAARVSESLYQGFMVAHVVHFAAVTWYAVLAGGHDLFPGGRDLDDVGGWPTVAGIFTAFTGMTAVGWVGRPTATRAGRRTGSAGMAARTVIGTMFTGTFAGQLSRSTWYAVPTVISATATVLGTLGSRKWLS